MMHTSQVARVQLATGIRAVPLSGNDCLKADVALPGGGEGTTAEASPVAIASRSCCSGVWLLQRHDGQGGVRQAPGGRAGSM